MVTWHLTMKLFPDKCPERATLRKLWRQTGNSSLLPAKCWPLLHVIRACSWRWPDFVAGIPARFSKFAFVLFCYITNHLMTGPLGNSEFCFPRISMFPETKSINKSLHKSAFVNGCDFVNALRGVSRRFENVWTYFNRFTRNGRHEKIIMAVVCGTARLSWKAYVW